MGTPITEQSEELELRLIDKTERVGWQQWLAAFHYPGAATLQRLYENRWVRGFIWRRAGAVLVWGAAVLRNAPREQ